MLKRMHELFDEFRDEHGIITARKMAKKQCLDELIDELCEENLTTTEKVDKIIEVLELMNMKVD
jgi:hypothetical protein